VSTTAASDLADPAPARAADRGVLAPRTADDGKDAVLGLLSALAALLYLAVWLIEGPPVVG
jgi:hypothetical protein